MSDKFIQNMRELIAENEEEGWIDITEDEAFDYIQGLLKRIDLQQEKISELEDWKKAL